MRSPQLLAALGGAGYTCRTVQDRLSERLVSTLTGTPHQSGGHRLVATGEAVDVSQCEQWRSFPFPVPVSELVFVVVVERDHGIIDVIVHITRVG